MTAEYMWEVLNIVVPHSRKTPNIEEEIKQAIALQEFLDKPISEVFPPTQKKPLTPQGIKI